MTLEFQNLNKLIKHNLNNSETQEAQDLFSLFKNVKFRGFFTKPQFYAVVMWKTPRPKNHYIINSEKSIKDISKKILLADSENEKVNLLTSLKGVSIPVASAILTIIDPKNYGIIDIRVWKLLHLYKEVKTKPGGQGFNLNDYMIYLSILRKYAKQFKKSVRDIERTLFFYHKKIQRGNLYSK